MIAVMPMALSLVRSAQWPENHTNLSPRSALFLLNGTRWREQKLVGCPARSKLPFQSEKFTLQVGEERSRAGVFAIALIARRAADCSAWKLAIRPNKSSCRRGHGLCVSPREAGAMRLHPPADQAFRLVNVRAACS
jgi:hypothetical protein